MIYPILYKETSTGKTQTWQVEIEDGKTRTISGQLDGLKVTSSWKECKPKNIGKANETTPQQQAELETDAKYIKKQEQGRYHTSIDEIGQESYVSPMLAKNYKDRPCTQGDFNSGKVISQPKLDGMRCIVTKDGMTSRNGKPILSCPHIMEAYATIFEHYPDAIFDGELYTDKLKNDFDSLMSLVKREKVKPKDLVRSKALVQHWVYDLVDKSKPFIDRILEAKLMISPYIDGINKLELIPKSSSHTSPYILLVPTSKVRDQDHMDGIYAGYLEAGMEGQMIRYADSPYKINGRSPDLLKRKEFLDDEFKIIRFEEGEGNWSRCAKKAYFKINGEEFKAGIKGTQEYTKDLLENQDQYIGREATVRYQNLTPKGTPRFGVVHHIYEGKRDE